MLSYQHEYHAGNHADVLKHVTFLSLILALQRKPAALRIIDTHAGCGSYRLDREPAQRHREFESGAARILAERGPTAGAAAYLAALNAANGDGTLLEYPGSPALARACLRPHDQLELFELHPRAFTALRQRFVRDRQVHVHRRDGFEGLVAVVPPRERRGVVLIDPAYENSDEFERTLDALQRSTQRWANGVYAIWYPLLRKRGAAVFVDRLERLKLHRTFQIEVVVAEHSDGLRGSGLIIVNLPYGLDADLSDSARWLHARLADVDGRWRARWLSRD